MGLIERVIWLTPDYPYSYDKFFIGNLEGTNKVGTNSTSRYIGDEERLTKYENFGKAKYEVTIICKINYFFKIEFITMKIEDFKKLNFKLHPSKTLLDIDYDYFSTKNPFLDSLTKYFDNKQQTKNALSIFHPNNYCLSNIKLYGLEHLNKLKTSIYQNKREGKKDFWINRILHKHLYICFLGDKTELEFSKCSKISKKLWCKGMKEATKFQLHFKEYMDFVKDVEEKDSISDVGDLIQDASTAMSLPESNKSFWQIRKEMMNLKSFLLEIGLNSPSEFISLAQSIDCGHTPKYMIEFIKYELYEMLNSLLLSEN